MSRDRLRGSFRHPRRSPLRRRPLRAALASTSLTGIERLNRPLNSSTKVSTIEPNRSGLVTNARDHHSEYLRVDAVGPLSVNLDQHRRADRRHCAQQRVQLLQRQLSSIEIHACSPGRRRPMPLIHLIIQARDHDAWTGHELRRTA